MAFWVLWSPGILEPTIPRRQRGRCIAPARCSPHPAWCLQRRTWDPDSLHHLAEAKQTERNSGLDSAESRSSHKFRNVPGAKHGNRQKCNRLNAPVGHPGLRVRGPRERGSALSSRNAAPRALLWPPRQDWWLCRPPAMLSTPVCLCLGDRTPRDMALGQRPSLPLSARSPVNPGFSPLPLDMGDPRGWSWGRMVGCSLTQMDILALGRNGAGFSADHFYPKRPQVSRACGCVARPLPHHHLPPLAVTPVSRKDTCHWIQGPSKPGWPQLQSSLFLNKAKSRFH